MGLLWLRNLLLLIVIEIVVKVFLGFWPSTCSFLIKLSLRKEKRVLLEE